MKFLLATILLIFSVYLINAQNRQNEIQTNSRLARSYYNDKEFEKAAPLFLEVYNLSRNSHYFWLYVNSLIELNRFEEAEMQIREEIKKQRNPNTDLYINWGYLLKSQDQNEKAEEKYSEALEMIPPNKGNYLTTANSFLKWREYGWAKKVYLKGRKVIPQEQFNYELARVYLYLRDYDKMMEEYLDLLRQDENQLRRIESSLSSALRIDVEDELRDRFRKQILKRIQAEPNIMGYNRLLIWFFLQERQFAAALRQLVALDNRTGNEDAQIFQLGRMALNNKKYSDAKSAFNYLLEKGRNNPFYDQAFAQNIHTNYLQYITESTHDISEGQQLAEQFEKGMEFLGYTPAALNLIQEYGNLLAFYLDDADRAVLILEKALKIPRLKPEESGELKALMADIYIYAGDLWEAVLLYSQVIDNNKNNSLGDEVKLKKARLGYYMGDFSWAKAQLDILKASTSKLTANDAMELSMLIGNNLNLDTTAIPLQMFARADLLFFRNKDSLALATLDSIAGIYPYHSLVDDILFRKSKIEIDRNNFEKAAEYLEKIRTDFSYELLADNALFMLAELYNYNLDEKEKAKELYRELMTRYPGSVFVDESREKFRELRGLYPDEITIPAEDIYIDKRGIDEFN